MIRAERNTLLLVLICLGLTSNRTDRGQRHIGGGALARSTIPFTAPEVKIVVWSGKTLSSSLGCLRL